MRSDWRKYCLGDLTEWFSGATPPKNNSEFWGGDIPWISASSMKGNRFKDSELKITNKALISKSKLVPQNTILLLVRGSALHNKIPVGITLCPVTFNQDVKAIRIKEYFLTEDIIDPWYLLYWFIEKRMYLLNLVENTGIGAGKFDTKQLQNLIIYVPPKEERKNILQIAKVIDDKIELNHKMNLTLEEMAQALFKSWFIDFDPVHVKVNAAGREDALGYKKAKATNEADLEQIAKELGIAKEVLDLFPDEFEESELGMIPKGWEVVKFKTTVEKYIDNRGKTPPVVENGIPLLEVRNMPDDMLTSTPDVSKFVTDETYNSWFRSHLETDDILISTVGTIGKTCIVPIDSKITIAQNVLGLRFKSKLLDKKFMFYQMKSRRFLHAINARLVVTVQASIKRKDLDTIDVIIPSMAVQNVFLKYVQPLMEKQQSNENLSLQKTRDTLLPKLLSGELDVSELNLEVQ